MTDITMCNNDICPMRVNCYRHTENGTQPNPYVQSWSHFNQKKEDKCDYYWENNEYSEGKWKC